MRTETVTYLKKHAADLPVVEEPLVITQNGLPAYVIESAKEHQRKAEAIALMKLLAFSNEDKKQGRVHSEDDFISHLQRRKAALIK